MKLVAEGRAFSFKLDKNNLNKVAYLSYSRRDILLVLLLYVTACFVFVSLVREDLKGCVLVAFSVALIASFFVTIFHMVEILNNKVKQLQEEQAVFTKSIKEEYQRIYKLKRKHALILKAVRRESEYEGNVILNVEDPQIDMIAVRRSHFVHFNYLNKSGNMPLKEGRHPQG